MNEWENFLSARKQFLSSIGAMRRLAPETQALALENALAAGQEMDVMEYLTTVEDPESSSAFPVAERMIESLGGIATFPGENAGLASTYLAALSKDGKLLPAILSMADKKVSKCMENPGDDEIWMYTAEMLRAVDEKKFQGFMDLCRNHPQENIRNVAAFFEE